MGKEMVPSLQVLDTGLGMQQALHTRGLLLVTGVYLPICLCCGDMKAEDSAIFVPGSIQTLFQLP